jgi:hypothetical protein
MMLGHGAHGKDTVCELLPSEFEFINSSYAVCDIAVFPTLSERYGYKTIDECYDDRRSHRVEWKNLISAYNANDLTRLGRAIYDKCNVYNGIRARDEFEALVREGVIDYTIFVDASIRLPNSIDPSMDLNASDADFIIDNNGPEEKLPNIVKDVIADILIDWNRKKQNA